MRASAGAALCNFAGIKAFKSKLIQARALPALVALWGSASSAAARVDYATAICRLTLAPAPVVVARPRRRRPRRLP